MGPNYLPDWDALDQLGALGVIDVAWADMEHGPTMWRELGDFSRVCDLWGMTSLVRVTSNDPAVIGRTLDRGVQSVLVPHVNTRDDAERAVAAAYYAPAGSRGVSGTRQAFGVSDYYHKANDEVMVVLNIEEVEAVRNLPEILKVDGVDCLLVAPMDLGQSMGPQYLGQMFNADVQALVREAVATIVAAGRSAGTVVNSDNVEDYLKLGVRFLRFSTQAYIEEGLRNFHKRIDAAL